METGDADASAAARIRLETFLSGMETCTPRRFDTAAGPSLKPSLVEWKPRKEVYGAATPCPLKPSLVEWKHPEWVEALMGFPRLETFLSGMETEYNPLPALSASSLETFLSGMETRCRPSACRSDTPP